METILKRNYLNLISKFHILMHAKVEQMTSLLRDEHICDSKKIQTCE